MCRLETPLVSCEGYRYRFDPSACAACGGACCTGERGEIWIDREEILALSELLGEPEEVVIGCYLRRERTGYTIKERQVPEGYACWFLDPQSGGCGIYAARPKQCRSFPFWPLFKSRPQLLEAACPGVRL